MRPSMWRAAAISLPALFVLAAVSGCSTRDTSGKESIYHMDSWLGPAALAAGILAVVAGWVVKSWSARHGYTLMISAPVLLLLVGPSLFFDHVTVDPAHFEVSCGLWFAPTRYSVQFDDLRELSVRAIGKEPGADDLGQLRQGRGSPPLKIRYYFDCVLKNGQHVRLDLGALLEDAAGEILCRARERGVSAPQAPETVSLRIALPVCALHLLPVPFRFSLLWSAQPGRDAAE